MNTKPVYIHYGNDQFFKPMPIRNVLGWCKPLGGMWASRKDDEFGWINWCQKEEFRLEALNTSFEFILKDGARILTIDSVKQLDPLPKRNREDDFPLLKTSTYLPRVCYLDFEQIMKNYDAIELILDYGLYWALYGWDCNCILIMNPDIIELIPKEVDIH